MDNIHVVKETTLNIEKTSLDLVLSYFGSIFLQTRTKFKKSLKNILVVNCQQCLKIRPDQVTTFTSKIGFPKIFLLLSFVNSSVASVMSPIMVNVLIHLIVRIVEHIGISTLTKKQVNTKKNSVADHLLICNNPAS